MHTGLNDVLQKDGGLAAVIQREIQAKTKQAAHHAAVADAHQQTTDRLKQEQQAPDATTAASKARTHSSSMRQRCVSMQCSKKLMCLMCSSSKQQ